jgi:two-component system response regulator FixJ
MTVPVRLFYERRGPHNRLRRPSWEELSVASRRNVYVVDPDEERRRELVAFNQAKGMEPTAFASIEEFLQEAQRLKPGCVILGRLLADATPGVIDAIGGKLAPSPIIMIAAPASVVSTVNQMKSAASDLLDRPFQQTMVYEVLSWLFADLDHDLQLTCQILAAEEMAHRLTGRECEVLRGLVAGMANKAIAHQLGIAVRTVEMHRASMMKRLNAQSLSDALKIAFYAKVGPLPTAEARLRTLVVVPQPEVRS